MLSKKMSVTQSHLVLAQPQRFYLIIFLAIIVLGFCAGPFARANETGEGLVWPYQRAWGDQMNQDEELALQDIGLWCEGACLRRLQADHWNDRTKGYCENILLQVITDFIYLHKSDAYEFSQTFIADLAFEILRVSKVFGIDPFIMTGKIKAETNFRPDPPNSSGAVGLSQMTADGIREIHDQLGYAGSRHVAPGATTLLEAPFQAYLGRSDFQKLRTWLRARDWRFKEGDRDILRGERHIRFSLAMGAALLKVYFSHRNTGNGDYNKALQQFNAEATKAQYARGIIADAEALNRMAAKLQRGINKSDPSQCMTVIQGQVAMLFVSSRSAGEC